LAGTTPSTKDLNIEIPFKSLRLLCCISTGWLAGKRFLNRA